MNKKQIAIILLLLVVFIATVVVIYSTKKESKPEILDTTNEQYLLYKSLDEKFKDCGEEEIGGGSGYNYKNRDCFLESYNSCEYSKIYQKLTTTDNDVVYTTATVDGLKSRGCAIHVYIDSFVISGGRGSYNTECYDLNINESSGQKSLYITECAGGTEHVLY